MSTPLPFNTFGLIPAVLSALAELGYEMPTPIQEKSIPVLLEGDDLLAQAQTGTGKTAAFALPALSQTDVSMKQPQFLILAPTRELAIQVSEAFQSYAKHMGGFRVTAIYGGQDYGVQLKALKRGVHVVVGTPGRVMDHLRRGTLEVDQLKAVILDEADEMLKMGFIEDITWILDQITHEHQTALFSATMPASIQKIANRYLKDAKKIKIKAQKNTADNIEQYYIRAHREQKLDILTRFLEIESMTAAIIFVRTKTMSTELAEKLQARGYLVSALNGNMDQVSRENVIERIKKGTLDIVVATDVAARGIDVDRITHVINYDIPYDTEAYIHRIGRTGRAGRTGKALLFITPREKRLLNDIQHAIQSPILELQPPTREEIQENRDQDLAKKISGIVAKSKKLNKYREMADKIMQMADCNAEDTVASLLYLMQQNNPLPDDEIVKPASDKKRRGSKPESRKKAKFHKKSKPKKRRDKLETVF